MSQFHEHVDPACMASTGVAMASALVLMALLATGAQASEPHEPLGRVQLAAELRQDEHPFGEDVDADEWPPPSSHRGSMPGQKPGTTVSAPPHGYDAKRLNRLWGRFRGAKPNTKTEKRPK